MLEGNTKVPIAQPQQWHKFPKKKKTTKIFSSTPNWAGWPATANTFSRRLPSAGVILRKKNKTKQAVGVSQHPEFASAPPSLKSQLKTRKAATTWFQTFLIPPPHPPPPSLLQKPLLELVHGTIKIRSEAKSTPLPSGISAESAKMEKKKDRKAVTQQSVLFAQMSIRPPSRGK